MSHFDTTGEGILAEFTPEERMFLGDVLPLLAGLGEPGKDPAATRLQVPVYLEDPEANDEWWRLIGPDLKAGRFSDRDTFKKVVDASEPVVLDSEEALAFLRVLNEARLALGARLGVRVEEDHEQLPEDSRQVMDYLGWILEELTAELSKDL